MPKDTKSLGNNKAPACESRGFVLKKKKVRILTHLHSLFIINVILIVAGLRMTDPDGSRNCSNRLHCNAVHQPCWYHSCNIKQSEGAQLYAVNSIPHTVLIDGDGTIIARGLHGEELQTKIAEAVK